jgi:catechol 2,3-dioxygenase-like lactoylglutathione lyase family enzyme
MITPAPRAIRPDFRYGDIGLNKMTITVFDVEKFYRGFNDKVNFCSAPKSTIIAGLGDYHFVYAKDPEGNLLEFVSAANLPANDRFGSIHWLGIGVTDLPRSITFYQKFAGLSTTVIDIHESFSGLAGEVSGGRLSRVLSCLLSTGQGAGMLELFEVTQPRGRSIPAFTQWGDYGFWQACLLCDDSDKAAEYFTQTGVPFFSSLQHMPDGGAFIYVQDPDGIPLEFLSFPQNP